MRAQQKMNDEIEKTLALLDQPESLPPDAFFYTRLQAQLDARRQRRRFFAAVLKPALLVALAVRLFQKYGTFDIAKIRRLRG